MASRVPLLMLEFRGLHIPPPVLAKHLKAQCHQQVPAGIGSPFFDLIWKQAWLFPHTLYGQPQAGAASKALASGEEEGWK